jgi:ribosome-binding protein aMBF1 (putative translation factor)
VNRQAKVVALGPVLKEARRKKGMTQLELSRHIGAHVTTVRRWERGLSSPEEWWSGALSRTFGREIVRDLGLTDVPIVSPIGYLPISGWSSV